MKSLAKLFALIIACSLLAGLTASAEDELVFKERFINQTGSNADFASIGWSTLLYDPQNADPTKPVDVSTLDGQPHAAVSGVSGNFGFEECFCNDDGGLVFMWTGAKETWYAMTYEGFTLNRSEMEITRVRWLDRSGHHDVDYEHEFRFMVKIGGSWYVSTTGYDPFPGFIGIPENWVPVEHTFTTDGSQWQILTADVDQAWNLSDPIGGTLPGGDIEGIGIYAYHPPLDGSLRFDELEIYAAAATAGPEPLLPGGELLGDNWESQPVFGTYNTGFWPWVNHANLGFVYMNEPDGGIDWSSVYFYHLGMQDWAFTAIEGAAFSYPVTYLFSLGAWGDFRMQDGAWGFLRYDDGTFVTW